MISILINGLSGKTGNEVGTALSKKHDINMIPYFVSRKEDTVVVDKKIFQPISLKHLAGLKTKYGSFLVVDYTHPESVNNTLSYYCREQIPFVCGTTGVDYHRLQKQVEKSQTIGVVSANMAKQIVGFMAMFEYLSNHFKNLFEGYRLEIKESHQAAKVDTSGTAIAMLEYFKALGVAIDKEPIRTDRNKRTQIQAGVPQAYLDGHAWHTYTLRSNDSNALFEFKHHVNGRSIYHEGTYDAIRFLAEKIALKERGKLYSMMDVLKK